PGSAGGGVMNQRKMLVGLIGANIMGSLSPALHDDAFHATGIDGYYHLMDVDQLKGRRLTELLAAVKTAGFAGTNVTFPFKQDIMALLDAVDPEAVQNGAVNTVTIAADRRTTGYNTDRRGFRRSFEDGLGRARAEAATIVLMGAGGAGRAVAFALMDLGVTTLVLYDRDALRATTLLNELTRNYGDARCRLAGVIEREVAAADGIVNATPVGMHGFPGNPVPVSALHAGHWAADVIYTPIETAFIKAAAAKGAHVLTGGGICVHQAVEAFRLFAGQGDFPLVEFMEAVRATGYDSELSLEIFNDQFRAGSPRSVAVDGQRSLVYLMDQMRGQGSAVPGFPTLPPRSKCLGVEFIEFAVDDRIADELAQFISGLGFYNAAQHKSKAVAHWTQGRINLVINKEKEGFAHSHYITHGPSVCAISLKVQSAATTLDRAEKLCDTPFRGKVGPGELKIPAVRGLGGSLLYFLDATSELAKVWDIVFEPAKLVTKDSSAGLTVVDHILQSMHYEDMLSWLLFYTSLLDVRKTPQVDITDPGGIVRSQVIKTADGALRIALNAPQSQRTQSSRFVTEYFGSGVQHIAFASDDIVATAVRLKANGVETLRIPEN
ncbi:MAG: shikimate dehydrogenase, partial [Pseudolabrys sp.]